MTERDDDGLGRRWLRFGKVVLSFAAGAAGGVFCAYSIFKATGTGYWWSYVTAVGAVAIVGAIAGVLTLWFCVAAVGTGALARRSRPSAFLAAWLGVAVAGVLAISLLVGDPVVGAFVVPLLAGMLVGRAAWPRQRESDRPAEVGLRRRGK